MKNISRRNNVKVFSNGEQPLLFAHGFGCDQNMWRFITPAFEKDYKIILFDYVGAGNLIRLPIIQNDIPPCMAMHRTSWKSAKNSTLPGTFCGAFRQRHDWSSGGHRTAAVF